jgi:hypothetical protein
VDLEQGLAETYQWIENRVRDRIRESGDQPST